MLTGVAPSYVAGVDYSIPFKYYDNSATFAPVFMFGS